MNTTENTTGPAVPVLHPPENCHDNGITLRDYFAVKAMLGLMATERAEEFVDENGDQIPWGAEEGESGTLFIHTHFLAEEAYMIADMMLKARGA